MVDNAACLCLALHQWIILYLHIGDFSMKFLILGTRHTIFKSRVKYGNKNLSNSILVYFFSLFKNVFWEKHVADNDFGYKTDVFKGIRARENIGKCFNLLLTNTWSILVSSSQMAALSKLGGRGLKHQKLYFSLTWSMLREWVLLNCFLTQSRRLTLIPGMLEHGGFKVIYQKKKLMEYT